jgi:hypothetical protein
MRDVLLFFHSEREISICKYCLCLGIPVILANIFIATILIAIYRQSGNPVVNSDQSEMYLFTYNYSTVSII